MKFSLLSIILVIAVIATLASGYRRDEFDRYMGGYRGEGGRHGCIRYCQRREEFRRERRMCERRCERY